MDETIEEHVYGEVLADRILEVKRNRMVQGTTVKPKMTKNEFMDITGEDPIDVIGPDWENEVEEWLEDNGFNSDDGI